MTEAKSRYPFPADDFNAIFDALADDTNCHVLVLGVDGVVQWANQTVISTSGKPREEIINAPVASLFPAPYVEERMKFVLETAATGRPIVCEGLTRGLFRRTTFRPLQSTDSAPDRVLVVCRPHPQDATPTPSISDLPVRRAAYDDLGPLSVLTDRELELLDLIGRGLSTAQIAARLGRSAKTVEWHRVSLGEKLHATNRVELARIALNAGLSMGPLPAARIDAPRQPSHHARADPAPTGPTPSPTLTVETKPGNAPATPKPTSSS